MLKIEKNVIVPRDIALAAAIQVAEGCYKKYGYVCRITSLKDGVHSPRSYHYIDLAVDFGLAGVLEEHHTKIADDIRSSLPDYYDVVYEGDHIHLELDLRKYKNVIAD